MDIQDVRESLAGKPMDARCSIIDVSTDSDNVVITLLPVHSGGDEGVQHLRTHEALGELAEFPDDQQVALKSPAGYENWLRKAEKQGLNPLEVRA